jgi:hypothetical protein
MPYSIGERGSYGCSGYPVVKDSDKEVMGCHETREAAARQIAAIESSEAEKVGIKAPDEWPETKRETDRGGMGSRMGQPHPASTSQSVLKDPKKKPKRSIGGVGGSSAGAVATTGGGSGMGTKSEDELNPKPKTEEGEFQDDVETRDSISRVIGKDNMFADFGKDYTKSQRLTEIFKAESVRVGQMVSWNSSGGRARGKVKRIITNGSYNVPGSDFTITGTPDNPAVVITLYRDGKPTDTTVAHRRSSLRAS